MPRGRTKLPENLSGLLGDQWETILKQACFHEDDADILRLCVLSKLPQIDVAEELGISRSTIHRRLPEIIKRAQCVAEKLNIH